MFCSLELLSSSLHRRGYETHKTRILGLEKENFARLTFRDEEQGRSKTVIDDDGFLVSYAMHSYMGQFAHHQKDQPLAYGFLIGALLTESFQHARTKYFNNNMPRAVTIAEQGRGAVQEQMHKQEHRKQIDQQFPMTAVWTAEKAQAQTRILLAIFKAFKEEKKGRNFAFMPSSFYAVIAPLWELWLRNNPMTLRSPGSPAYISIPDARYQQERLLRSDVLRTDLLFYRDRPLEESTALALQSSGMECMTGAMSPEELVRRVNLFSSKVTEGMIPEAIKRELVPTPALLIAASEYIKVL